MMAFPTQGKFRMWLDKNHAKASEIWIKLAKKGSGIKSVTYQEAVDVALCYGWIDGVVRRLDDDFYLQRFTPRRSKSKWSKINRAKVEQLIKDGKMKPAGLAEIERAKADGRWDAAYDSPSTMDVPDDLRRELDKNPRARRFFETLSKSNRYAVLYQIHDAKKPETRARRIKKFVEMFAEGKTLY
ncbi:MAG: YdeI/OmpD-associated family protein [Actinomycetota bacterium]|nr:YdeI/OmpD-associated family protein [Actinomycetota bacterium]